MKHKHAEMIKAWADNMELVVFINGINEWEEVAPSVAFPAWFSGTKYFLCLPKHKEAVLHWLNGGDVIVDCALGEQTPPNATHCYKWNKDAWYMAENCESRTKPKKEKRWIGVNPYCITSRAYTTKEEAEAIAAKDMPGEFQFIEIEVEV